MGRWGKEKKNPIKRCDEISFLCYLFVCFCFWGQLRLHFSSLKAAHFGVWIKREMRKVEERKLVPIPCYVNKTVLLSSPSCSCFCSWLLLLPLPRRGLLCRGLLIYRTLVCEWQKFLGISICLLITFQIMCCSLLWLAQKQFCYSYVGLPWIFFPLLVHWKHHCGGGEANEKMFLCLHHLKSLF